jgi:predicted ATPase
VPRVTLRVVEVHLLGDVLVTHAGVDLTPRGAKQRLLLAVLALRCPEAVSTDRLADVLWGGDLPANPANAIQAQVSALRKTLPAGTVVTRPGGYALAIAPGDIDIHRFDVGVGAARELLADGRARDAAARLRAALSLWRGPALAEFPDVDIARVEAARLDEERLSALELRLDADLADGQHAAVLGELELLCAAHPLRERFWVQRMLALYRSGRQAEALRAAAEVRTILVDELGLEPGPELRRTEAMVLAHDPAVGAPAAPRRPSGRSNLRQRLNTFVGREGELRRIVVALGEHRLVTLVGPGGAGKTRLAVEVGDSLLDRFADGVWLVELAPVADGAGVVPALLNTLVDLDVAGPGDERAGGSTHRLVDLLSGRSVLIVLDNCEHVVHGAAAACHDLLTRLPGLHVLATSREALGVPGEELVPVPPLDVAAASLLFHDRVRAATSSALPDDPATGATVAEICRRLDGLPLAIELAAARSRALSVHQIADRLGDRFRLLTGGARTAVPRQQTLRAVVDWSHDLLFEDEQRLFARLAVFANGCRLDAAEAVCGDALLPAVEVAELLGRLVDKSLVVVEREGAGDPRYRQLQTLWLYARERLAASGEADQVRARHAAWFLDEARIAGRSLVGPDGPSWRERVAHEMGDLRAALDWFVERDDGASATLLVSGVAWFWFLRAEWEEGARWLDDALRAGGHRPSDRAMAQQWHAYFSAFVDPARDRAEESRGAYQVLRVHGSVRRRGAAGLLHASTLNRLGGHAEAIGVLAETEPLLERSGNRWGQGVAALLAATAHLRLGDLDGAEQAARRSIGSFEQVGEQAVVAESLSLLAQVVARRGDLHAALGQYSEVVERCRQRDLPGYLAHALLSRGAVALQLGQIDRATADFAEAAERSRNPVNTAVALVGGARTAGRSGDLAGARVLADRAGAVVAAADGRGGGVGAAVGAALEVLGIAGEGVLPAR